MANVADISIDVNPVHPEKAEAQILISEAGNVTDVNDVQFRNELGFNESTVAGTTKVVAFPPGN